MSSRLALSSGCEGNPSSAASVSKSAAETALTRGAHSTKAHRGSTKIEIQTPPSRNIRWSAVAHQEHTRPGRGSRTCCHRRSQHYPAEKFPV